MIRMCGGDCRIMENRESTQPNATEKRELLETVTNALEDDVLEKDDMAGIYRIIIAACERRRDEIDGMIGPVSGAVQ